MFDYKVFPINSVNTYNNRQKQESQDTKQKNFERQTNFKKVLRDIVSIEADREPVSIEIDRKEVEYMACNHNPNDKNTTLKKIHKRIMVTPTTFWFRCNECFRGFKFVKNIDGKLEEVSE